MLLRARDMVHVRRARLHALKRLRQRFGIDLDTRGLIEIERAIIAGRHRWVSARPLRQVIFFEVPIGAVVTYPIFSVQLWTIVSFVKRVNEVRTAAR